MGHKSDAGKPGRVVSTERARPGKKRPIDAPRPRRPMTFRPRRCEWCQADYQPGSSRQRCCSEACLKASKRHVVLNSTESRLLAPALIEKVARGERFTRREIVASIGLLTGEVGESQYRQAQVYGCSPSLVRQITQQIGLTRLSPRCQPYTCPTCLREFNGADRPKRYKHGGRGTKCADCYRHKTNRRIVGDLICVALHKAGLHEVEAASLLSKIYPRPYSQSYATTVFHGKLSRLRRMIADGQDIPEYTQYARDLVHRLLAPFRAEIAETAQSYTADNYRCNICLKTYNRGCRPRRQDEAYSIRKCPTCRAAHLTRSQVFYALCLLLQEEKRSVIRDILGSVYPHPLRPDHQYAACSISDAIRRVIKNKRHLRQEAVDVANHLLDQADAERMADAA